MTFLSTNADLLIKWLRVSLHLLYFFLVFIFYKTSIGDLTSLDIILPCPDDGTFEPKRYNIVFFLIKFFFFFLWLLRL